MEILEHITTPDFDQLYEAWKHRINGDLQELFLEHTKNSVPIYKKCSTTVLEEVPLTTWEDHTEYESRYSNAYTAENTLNYFSSGKTGLIMKMRWDSIGAFGSKFQVLKEQADLMGLTFESDQPGIILLDDNPEYNESAMRLSFLNNAIYFRKVLGKGAIKDKEIIQWLRSHPIPVLGARPRVLKYVMDLDRSLPKTKNRGFIKPQAIRSSGDNLSDSLRKKMEDWFGCKVYNVYKSQEGGMIAMDCKYENGMHLFPDRSIVEVADSKNQVKPNGKGFAVITNLENWAMPFIRYRTNDIIQLDQGSCTCGFKGKSITRINGSDSPYFIFEQEIFNPSRFNTIFEQLPVRQFQIVQENKGRLVVKWVAAETEIDFAGVSSTILKKIIEKTGLNTALLNVQRVDAIDSDENGKVRRYMAYKQIEVV